MSFLKAIMTGKKAYLKQSDVKFVKMPRGREVSVKVLLPLFQDLPYVRDFLPDDEQRGHRLPEAEFFFGVIAT
jgi:hypothetical protein